MELPHPCPSPQSSKAKAIYRPVPTPTISAPALPPAWAPQGLSPVPCSACAPQSLPFIAARAMLSKHMSHPQIPPWLPCCLRQKPSPDHGPTHPQPQLYFSPEHLQHLTCSLDTVPAGRKAPQSRTICTAHRNSSTIPGLVKRLGCQGTRLPAPRTMQGPLGTTHLSARQKWAKGQQLDVHQMSVYPFPLTH